MIIILPYSILMKIDDLNEWHGIQTQQKQQQNKMAALEIIRNSKQYRMLFDMGFKKEEIEVALRAANLNLEDAIEILNQSRSANSMDAWRRHDEHNTGAGNFDHNNFPQRYPAGPQMPFPPVRILRTFAINKLIGS